MKTWLKGKKDRDRDTERHREGEREGGKEEEIAKQENITRIWLFSGFHRNSAHELYRKLGYDENRDKAFVKQIK